MERPSGPDPAELNELVSQLSTEALLLSEASLVDAWALRRLADRYGHVPLAPKSKWLLEVMINDHREAIARNVSAELAILRRILEAGFSGADEIVEPAAFLEAPAGSWGEEVLTVFGGVAEIDGLIHAALAASSEPPDQSPSRILGRLVAVVPEVQSRLSRLAASESPLTGRPSVATR
jgi:hypothetical protein